MPTRYQPDTCQLATTSACPDGCRGPYNEINIRPIDPNADCYNGQWNGGCLINGILLKDKIFSKIIETYKSNSIYVEKRTYLITISYYKILQLIHVIQTMEDALRHVRTIMVWRPVHAQLEQ
jgi:hypothetical protein